MSQFSYSFCLSLFHSLWQCALLLVIYAAIQPLMRKQLPSFKRNILYSLLLIQVIISCITFFIYYSSSLNFYKELVEANLSGLLVKQPLIEEFAPWILLVYAVVLFIKSVSLTYSWYRFKKLCSSTMVKPSIELKLFTIKKANEFGIYRKVNLWFSDAVSTPLTFGFLKPVILMPVALLNQLSVAEAESLIIHELTHIKNNDYLLNWLLVITETIFFYNPFIKIIASKIKLEREKNCDIQVLQFQYPGIKYAETLLKAARFKSNINSFPLAAVFKNKQLLQRIHFFTKDQNLVFTRKKHSAVSLSVIILALLLNVFVLTQIKNINNGNHNDAFIPQIPHIALDGMVPEFNNEAMNVAKTTEPVSKIVLDNNQPGILQQQYLQLKAALAKMNEAKAYEAIPDENIEADYAVPAVNVIEENNEDVDVENQSSTPVNVCTAVNVHPAVSPIAKIQPDEKEVIITEECSGSSQAITKAYKVKLKDGKWKDELMYVIKEGKKINDSIIVNLKDSIRQLAVPSMQ